MTNVEPFAAWRAFKFLFIGPLIVVMAFVVNYFTSPEYWWAKWVLLGIGIAWFVCLLRLVKTALIVGGLAALIALFRRH